MDEDGREMRVGIFRGKKGKRERKYEKKKNEIENEMKINGDGYGKINWWKKKWGLGWSEQNE